MPNEGESWDNIIRGLNGAYTPITGFHGWPKGNLPFSLQPKPLQSKSVMRGRAIRTVLRIAAAKSGEIEDLYELARGVTLNIGEDKPDWRQSIKPEAVTQIDAHIQFYESLRGAVDDTPNMSAAFIRSLHVDATEGQETYGVSTPQGIQQKHELPKGKYKTRPNHVLIRDGLYHAYCPPRETDSEMLRLVDELNSDAFQRAGGLGQASYAHWALTHIHPFADGNGRVARGLASFYLFRSYDIPLLIYADRKFPYFQALALADQGDGSALADYITSRAVDTYSWVTELEKEYSSPPLGDEVAKLVALASSLSGVHLENRDIAAVRVKKRLIESIQTIIDNQLEQFPGDVEMGGMDTPMYPENCRDILQKNLPGDNPTPFGGYFNGGLTLKFSMTDPARYSRDLHIFVGVVLSLSEHLAVKVKTSALGVDDIGFRLDDCSPTLSESTEVRLRTFASRAVAGVVQDFLQHLEQSLLAAGKEPNLNAER